MPSRRRCAYKEGGRRCARDGYGQPPLCPACRLAIAAAILPPKPGQVFIDALHDLVNGREIDTHSVMAAVGDLLGPAPLGAPPPPWVPRPIDTTPRPAPAAPPLAPEISAARRTLGYTDRQVLTTDEIKKRRHQLVKRYHPDRVHGDPVKSRAYTQRMADINAAADVLIADLQG